MGRFAWTGMGASFRLFLFLTDDLGILLPRESGVSRRLRRLDVILTKAGLQRGLESLR